jgi:Hypoxia induced protein conserved region
MNLSRSRGQPRRRADGLTESAKGDDRAQRSFLELPYMIGQNRSETDTMEGILHGATYVALAAVVIVLLLGIVNMMRGTSPNRSQTLMRWRVILQFVALVVMMTALYCASRH